MSAIAATEAENNRMRHGEKETMIAVTCSEDKNEWQSSASYEQVRYRKYGLSFCRFETFGGGLHHRHPRSPGS
jgi:hypothetical protein